MPAEAPFAGWERTSKTEAATRWHRSWPIALFLAAIWNFTLPAVMRRGPSTFELVGMIAGTAFAFLAVRAFAAKTRITMDATELRVRTALAPWSKLAVPLADVAGFETIPHDDEGHVNVGVRLRSGEVRELPIDWQPLPLTWRGSKKRWFVAEDTCASKLKDELDDMLAEARQLGHDTYRT